MLIFLPSVVLAYYFLTARAPVYLATYFLLIASLLFYGWWNPKYLLLLCFSIVANNITGHLIQGSKHAQKTSKLYLTFGIFLNLATLGYFKYANFFLENVGLLSSVQFQHADIILPLAISFFTFQQIALLVDIYQEKTERPSLLNHSLFVCFFPQLVAGPIVHHSEMMPQFSRTSATKKRIWMNLSIGAFLVCTGLLKKVVIADNFAIWADNVFNFAQFGGQPTFFESWIGVLCFSLQIYFDFSAYSDIAIGAARMFGIILPLNFNSPYQANNIADFWRRWHITLSRFLFQYIYLPLGGNRLRSVKTFRNLVIVMILGGLWHGAAWTFIFWGIAHGCLLVLHRMFVFVRQKEEDQGINVLSLLWSRLLTFTCVSLTWVLFRAADMNAAVNIYKGLIGLNGVHLPLHYKSYLGQIGQFLQHSGVTFGPVSFYAGGWQLVWIFTTLLFVFFSPNNYLILKNFTPASGLQRARSSRWSNAFGHLLRYPVPFGIALGLAGVWAIIKILQGEPGEFIYFQF